ncbi:MAG: HAD-IA family hydrolase [Planctomycetota bacterium]
MLLLFDLDGTLIDSVADIATSVNELRARHRLAPLDLATVAQFVGHGVENLVARTTGIDDRTQLEQAVRCYQSSYDRHCLEHTRPYAGVAETLPSLRAARHSLAVISNKPEGFSVRILRELALLEHFDLVVGGDTVCPPKPDAAPLVFAMRRLRFAPQDTWMIGDSPSDLQAGRAAGCRTIAVTWGLRSRAALEHERPDRIIDRFAALLEILAA